MAKAVLYLLVYIFLALFPVTLAVVQAPTVGAPFSTNLAETWHWRHFVF